jgi:hypothetical protein
MEENFGTSSTARHLLSAYPVAGSDKNAQIEEIARNDQYQTHKYNRLKRDKREITATRNTTFFLFPDNNMNTFQ